MSDIDEIKALAEDDLYTFAVLVNPKYLYGQESRISHALCEEMEKSRRLLVCGGGGSFGKPCYFLFEYGCRAQGPYLLSLDVRCSPENRDFKKQLATARKRSQSH